MKDATFFLIVTPGLEDSALLELQSKLRKDVQFERVKGGLLLNLSEIEGWALNHMLKIPTRILQKLDQFKARDFPKMYKNIKRLPWNEYLRNSPVDVKVSITASKLKMKERVRQTASEAIEDARKHQSFRKPFLETPQTVFIRVVEDEIEVSIDTSGPSLHLRGYKPFSVEAPLRETLASAMFFECTQVLGSEPKSVLDPMTGSGTLLFESHEFWQPNYSRKYSYENFPKCPGIPRLKSMGPSIEEAVGIDIDSKAVEAAQNNAEIFFSKRKGQAKYIHADFDSLREELQRPLIVLVNPPYNARLPGDRKAMEDKLDIFLHRIRPDVAAVMWPGEQFPWPCEKMIRTSNGGIPVTIGIAKF